MSSVNVDDLSADAKSIYDTINAQVNAEYMAALYLSLIHILLFLKDIKPTLVIACSIPLSVVFAVVLMYFTHITFCLLYTSRCV